MKDERKLVEVALRYQRQVTPSLLEARRRHFVPKIQQEMASFKEQIDSLDDDSATIPATITTPKTVAVGAAGAEAWNLVEDEGGEEEQGPPPKLLRDPSFELVDDEEAKEEEETGKKKKKKGPTFVDADGEF